ncbi:hypothetical protein GCM10029964_105300 [Kibdelosporangium lantanae]
MDTLGALAHHGGMLVERPELTVGLLTAISRTSGLEIELLARQPLDRRDPEQRKREIRQRVEPAPRRLLPQFDEGMDLRVGRLNGDRAEWLFTNGTSGSSGDHYQGTFGPSIQGTFLLPATYDTVDLVLAWPEIGFPETVVTLPLPDQATVTRATVDVWQAPVNAQAPPTLSKEENAGWVGQVAVEAGRSVAAPRVLNRGKNAVVVLRRLTVLDSLVSLAIEGAGPDTAQPDIFFERTFPTIAVLNGTEATWLPHGNGGTGSDGLVMHVETEFLGARPAGDVLDLLVGWPQVGLPTVRVQFGI